MLINLPDDISAWGWCHRHILEDKMERERRRGHRAERRRPKDGELTTRLQRTAALRRGRGHLRHAREAADLGTPVGLTYCTDGGPKLPLAYLLY